MKKRIVINALASLGTKTGVGRYTENIIAYLAMANRYEQNYFYGYFTNQRLSNNKHSSLGKLKGLATKFSLIKSIIRLLLSKISALSNKKYDLYFEPNFIPLKNIKAAKTIVSVHDFSFLIYQEYHTKERVEYFDKYFFSNIANADAIICFSEYTKNEVIKNIGINGTNVYVIYHGVDHNVFKILDNKQTVHNLPEQFIFCAGSIEPRKNLMGLLNAYNELNEDIKLKYKLVLVGFKGWENTQIMNLIKKNTHNIHYLGFVSDEELARLYNLASCFIYSSFYEGFGLPILEAMACGTPVICSNSSSMPEVGGDAVLYFDPNNIKELTYQITYLLTDKVLQQNLVQKGLSRAEQFSWEKSAKEHLDVFEEVLSR